MVEKRTEISLDEMLSSIKQMVVDKDPPVLELTDMISDDGTIVKVGSSQGSCSTDNEMRDFLRLAQGESDVCLSKNSPSPPSSENNSVKEDLSFRSVESHPISSEKMSIVISDVVREVAAPLIEKWLEKNLSSLVKEVVTAEVQKVVKQS